MRAAAAIVLAIALGACALAVADRVPGSVRTDCEDALLLARTAAARAQFDRGDHRAAWTAVEALGGAAAPSVDLQRLRQDLLRQRGRIGFLRAEADARVAAQADDPWAHYLRGRLLRGPEMLDEFRRAAQLAPDSVWPWLGQAFALRDVAPDESLRIYERLYSASDRQATVGIAFANALRLAGRLREAIEVYEHLIETGADVGVGQLGLAQSLFALGTANDRRRGWAALLAATVLRPFDPGVHGVVRELLRLGLADEQVEELLDVLRAEPERWRAFARGAGTEVLVALLERSRQPMAARLLLDQASADGSRADVEQLRRRLTLAMGDVAGYLRLLRDAVPAPFLADEANQVRGRWQTLFAGPWMRGDPLQDVGESAVLLAALRDVGQLYAVERLAESVRARWGDACPPAVEELRDEARREIAFEAALRRALYDGYSAPGAADLDEFLARARQLSVASLGRDVVGERAGFAVPLVGEMLDPFRAGLCLHLARYNRHLVLGRRTGGAVEGLMLTAMSARDLAPMAELPLPGRCREIVGFERSVRSKSGVFGGDLAGVALLNHYVIDYDAVVDWAASVANRRRIAHEDGDILLRDPLPVAREPLEAFEVGWRLALVSPLQDSQLEADILATIRLHERRHLVDSFHYLPIEGNLWRGLGLLIRFGMSPGAIEAEMERRAELAALALAERPELVLAHIADFLLDGSESPHAQGFTVLAGQLVAEFRREGLDADAASVARWDRLDTALVRRCAARLLHRLP